MRRGDVYRTSIEMLWKPDPGVETARALPEWARFHRLCGEHDLYFDRAERVGKQYSTVAFTVEYEPQKIRYRIRRFIFVASGIGQTVLESTSAAYAAANFPVSGADEMLARGLSGVVSMNFDELLG